MKNPARTHVQHLASAQTTQAQAFGIQQAKHYGAHFKVGDGLRGNGLSKYPQPAQLPANPLSPPQKKSLPGHEMTMTAKLVQDHFFAHTLQSQPRSAAVYSAEKPALHLHQSIS